MEHMHHDYNVTAFPFLQWVKFSTADHAVSYAYQASHMSMMWLHVALMVLATLVLMPAALMLKNSRYRPTIWIATSLVTITGTFVVMRHAALTEDLYEGATHRKFGFLVLACIFSNTIYVCWSTWRSRSRPDTSNKFVLVSGQEDLDEEMDSARSSETLYRRRQSSPTSGNHDESEKPTIVRSTFVSRLAAATGPINAALMLVLTYVQILLGIATYLGLFTQHEIFNGLAHWIKASVFLLFGIWVLMRYFGYGASIGHAWNTASRHSTAVSPETIESGLIFTYGACDLFLERLGHSDEPISHTDIQHMSIAMMFAGAGFIGLLIESRVIKRLLRRTESMLHSENYDEDDRNDTTCNVMPSLVVFFTGLLMSQHHQDSLFATQLHAAWGYYFCIAAVFRLVTYCLIYLSTGTRRAGHPPTEVLVSFSLIAGAFIFMLSARDVAQTLEYYAIDLMFVISLSVATALGIMVWTLYLMILRSLGR